MKFGIEKGFILILKKGEKKQWKEQNYQLKKTSEPFKKKKITNTDHQTNRDERKK